MRVATGGLAASDRITPLSISTRIAPSSGLSTVHHQSDSGVRSSREIMDVPNGQRAVPLVAEVGYRGVNGFGNFPGKLKRCHKLSRSYPAHAGYPVRRDASA